MTNHPHATLRACAVIPDDWFLQFSDDEIRCWNHLTACAKIKRRWIRGRIAAKAAVLDALPARERVRYRPSDIPVLPDDFGCPRAYAGGFNRPVSITHTDSFSLALAADPRDGVRSVGLDAEETGGAHEGLAEGGFSEEELTRIGTRDPCRLLPLWCAKEAAAKCAGRGFEGDPLNTSIRHVEDGGFSARVCVGPNCSVRVSIHSYPNTVYATAIRSAA